MAKNLLTRNELMAELQIKVGSFNNYINAGMPVAVKGSQGVPSKYDLDSVKAWLEKNVKSHNDAFNFEKLRKMTADASLAELELEKERGLVVPIEDAIKHISAEYTSIRAKLLGIPSQLCDELAVITDKKQVLHVLDSKIREILEELTADTLRTDPAPKKASRKKKQEQEE